MSQDAEREIKLRVASPGPAREALARAGAILVRPRHFEDNRLFDDPGRSLRARGALLRLRRVPGGGALTFKGPKSVVEGVKSRTEREIAVLDPDTLQGILEALGYGCVFRYQKYREAYSFRGVEVVVDETPLGAFLEIEGEVEAIRAAAAALGFAPGDFITDSYADLFVASGGTGDMVFP